MESADGVQISNKYRLLIWLITLHTALLVASNAAGAKMIGITDTLSASATVFSYSITFLLIDVIVELYGKNAAKLAIRVGFGALILSVAFISLSIASPPAVYWKGQEAYEATLGLGPRILLGGWASYMVSQFLDVAVFWVIRRMTNGKHLWLRAIGSMAFSQLIDTIIFMTIAFYGVFPLAGAIAGQYAIKIVIALLMTPLMYLIVPPLRSYLERGGALTSHAKI